MIICLAAAAIIQCAIVNGYRQFLENKPHEFLSMQELHEQAEQYIIIITFHMIADAGEEELNIITSNSLPTCIQRTKSKKGY
jgi:uncharacterized membrane-anchored protein